MACPPEFIEFCNKPAAGGFEFGMSDKKAGRTIFY